MNNIYRFVLSLIAVCLLGFLPMTVVWSADEDMISQVYLEFNPETGEFVTTQDPMLTGNSKHSAGQAKQVEQIQQAQDAMAAEQAANTQTIAAAPMATDSMESSNSAIMIAGGIALLFVVGIVAWTRKSQQTSA